jgi:hypothetical protein
MSERICRHCQHATTEPGHRQHYRVGLRNCEKLPEHIFIGGNHTCDKWTEKETPKESE